MGFITVKLRPGVNVEMTPVLNEAGISASNLIRFRDGLVEKIGGWVKFYAFTVGGIVRSLHAWQALNDDRYLATGTTTKLNVITEAGALTDITPQKKTTNPNEDFSTTSGSATVTIVDANVTNVTTYDSVYFNTPISVGGLILSGLYPIASVAGANTYRITAATLATATVANGGAVPAFTTTSGSPSVSVALNDHGLIANDTMNFPIQTTVGGVTIDGTYPVTSVTTANAFVITADAAATSSTTVSMNSGTAQLVYYITLGPSSGYSGYSIGTYSSGGYSTGTALTVQTGTPITSTDWTLDNWGKYLLACPEDGAIYFWEPNAGFLNAQLVSAGPIFNTGIFVSMQAQILVAYGSTRQENIGIDDDPLLIKWSSQLDFMTWTVSTTNQAGSYRIPTGSKIVGGIAGQQQDFIWTDLGIWSMKYIGYPLVYSFVEIGSGCGLVCKHGVVKQGANIFWMGDSNFFSLSEGVSPIPCSVWDKVFQNLNEDFKQNIRAWSNTPFNEVWWFYPSAASVSGENDSYVKYNTLYRIWDYGSLSRTAAIDQSVLGMPIAAGPTGLIFQHERGYNDDGAAINAFSESGWFVLAEGEEFVFGDWMIPNAKYNTSDGSATAATIQITLYTVNYPGGTPRTHGPYSVVEATKFVNTRLRGRFAKIRIESGDLGSYWRIGGIKLRIAPDGRR